MPAAAAMSHCAGPAAWEDWVQSPDDSCKMVQVPDWSSLGFTGLMAVHAAVSLAWLLLPASLMVQNFEAAPSSVLARPWTLVSCIFSPAGLMELLVSLQVGRSLFWTLSVLSLACMACLVQAPYHVLEPSKSLLPCTVMTAHHAADNK